MATESIYDQLAGMLAGSETVAVATIVGVKGSVPREVGAKMIIHPLGRHVGTVGGGCGEADVIRAAVGVMDSGVPTLVRVDLTEDVSMQALGVCGGIFDVFVERVGEQLPGQGTGWPVSVQAAGPGALVAGNQEEPGKDLCQGKPARTRESAAERVSALLASTAGREPVALVKVLEGPQPGSEAVIWLDRPPLGDLALPETMAERALDDAREVLRGRQHRQLRYAAEGVALFVEVQRRSPELVIVGAGHIAVPLAQLATICDFAVTVLDDRPAFASPSRFPTARRVLAAPQRETVHSLSLDEDSFLVLVTRGHTHDVECLLEVLDRPVAYIGMIGSQRRVDAVFKLLTGEMGIDAAKFDRIYAPIGIDIGAQTPAEIAVCVMAEIINVLRRGPAPSLADRRRARDRERLARKAALQA